MNARAYIIITLSLLLSLSLPAQRRDTITDGRPRSDLKVDRRALPEAESLIREIIYDEKTDSFEVGTRLRSRNTSTKGQSDNKEGSVKAANDTTIRGSVGIPFSAVGPTVGTATSYLTAPTLMSPDEYRRWSLRRSMMSYYRQRNAEAYATSGKSKFDFTNMKFNIGPAEKIFGPGGVQIKTQGSAELKLGINMKHVDNPSIAVNRRNTTGLDFDQKINFTMTGKVGDKVQMNLNYNTDATFDYDAQNLKLKYEGKEDEIIKLIEGGNVSFPSNNSLIPGLSSLFGLRTDLQFGKLKLQTVISQKKSASKNVSTKGGTSTTNFEIAASDYELNRHFYLSHYMREQYGAWMQTLPTIRSGITIKRIEVWVTNKTGATTNTRHIVAMAGLAENTDEHGAGQKLSTYPDNASGDVYATVSALSGVRDISTASTTLEAAGYEGGTDFEKLQSARLLSSSEYSVNTTLGTISLNTTLQPDEILAVAYEYTLNGATHQVGEFSGDQKENATTLIVKLLKSSSTTSSSPVWRLMMKNVYSLGASSMTRDKFKLDIKYLSPNGGTYVTYLPNSKTKTTPLLRALGLDRLDQNNKYKSDGRFDYIEGYTVQKGRIYFTVEEPFADQLESFMREKGVSEDTIRFYTYRALYDTTRIAAKQLAEKNKFMLMGRYSGSAAGEIDLGVTNVAPGSVVVTAGGVTLVENEDYTVDYNMGRVTIINQSILDAGTSVNASVESNDTYGMQRKTVLGLNFDYEVNKNLTIGGTMQYLSEQPLTTKVTIGNEPLKNLLWGGHISWKHEAQWLTNLVNKIPFIHATAPSQITFDAEVAQLVAMQSKSVQGGAAYIDDFEDAKKKTSLIEPTYWQLASTPSSTFADDITYATDNDSTQRWRYGQHRALLAWYSVDPLFTRRGSTLAPSYINEDSLSNQYVREIYERELYPNKTQTSYSSASTIPALNLAYYPSERGAYNLTRETDKNDRLLNPKENWGGMMRSIDNTDFETQNIEYLEFWLMDPFFYERGKSYSGPPPSDDLGGKLYIDLGEISEDILKDGKKFYESGMPTDGSMQYLTQSIWGNVPNTNSVTYAFNNTSGARARQDVGLNGLTDDEERAYDSYRSFLDEHISQLDNADIISKLQGDPASDNYHYYRGSDYDQQRLGIRDRYKRVNLPQGNSPDASSSPESYETSWKTTPDVEDINRDYTLNETERYAEYTVEIKPSTLRMGGSKYVTDIREATERLRNGQTETIRWYLMRVPIKDEDRKSINNFSDFSSVRFIRMYLTGFPNPIILRMGTLELVHGDWRQYNGQLFPDAASGTSGEMTVYSVNIDENGEKTPVNYVLPPGISRVTDPSQSQLVENNEQSLALNVTRLEPGDAKAIYKNCKFDMRKYKHIQMFCHANAFEGDDTNLQSGDITVFMRLGSDYQSNYYEYEVPLEVTPAWTTRGVKYDNYNTAERLIVWPQINMFDFDLARLTEVKKERNRLKSLGQTAFTKRYESYDPDHPSNKITIIGSPTLGEVKTIMIGIRNRGRTVKSAEVWVNELRLQEFTNEGGWAARGALNIQLSDIGSFAATGRVVTAGFGSLEQTAQERTDENTYQYQFTASLDMGRLLPEKAKVTFPFYYSYGKNIVRPKYNTLDSDLLLDDALDALQTQHEKDSLYDLVTRREVSKNLSISGAKVNIKSRKHPMPYDPANFTFNYAQSSTERTGETTVYEYDRSWKGGLNYSWTPNWKSWEPFKNIKSKSKWMDIIKDQNIAFCPQNITFATDISRTYWELQERDLDDLENPTSIPVTFSSTFLWNRSFSLKWDIFKALHFSFQSATQAEIEGAQQIKAINPDLYPDDYERWKDSIKISLRQFGRPLTYGQQVSLSYKLPIHRIPIFDWITADGTYSSNYSWKRGTDDANGNTLGHTIGTQRTINVNGKFAMETLYNHSDFLKEVNKKFSASNVKNEANKKKTAKKREDDIKKARKIADEQARAAAEAESKKTGIPVDSILRRDAKTQTQTRTTAQNGSESAKKSSKRGFVQEVALKPDTTIEISHGQKSKRLIVKALDSKGREVKVRFKKIDDNKIALRTDADDTAKIRLNVVAKQPREEQGWYKWAEAGTRFLMMLRNVSVSYRNTYNLNVPGFRESVGALLGQNTTDLGLTPGIGFGLGLVDDSYIDKARENGWLMTDTTLSTPATSATTQDVQIKATLEPFTDLKIDLNMSHTRNDSKSIQYMFPNRAPSLTGSFNMTTITISTAFSSMGTADNGYSSSVFDRFLSNLDVMQQRIQQRYEGTYYPAGMPGHSGKYDASKTPVSRYSADVMIPAFLAAYQGRDASSSSTDVFPNLLKMLPNWSLSYKGLGNLPWVRDHFKSVTLTHAYKSIYSIGAYNSYSNYIQAIGGNDMGYAGTAAPGVYTASSVYDISTVSINETFSPLVGLNLTFNNNMTLKAEYKTARVSTLSITSAQINETSSKDFVIGWGWKINDFRLSSLFGGGKASKQAAKSNRSRRGSSASSRNTSASSRDKASSSSSSSSSKKAFAHDLNLRFDFSLRDQAAIRRDIQSGLCEATSGQLAIKASAQIDYTMSRYITMSIYYDRQHSKPLLSSQSYPTVTQDFGMTMKVSLTR